MALMMKFFSYITWLGTPFFYAPATAYLWKTSPESVVRLIVSIALIEAICGTIKLIYPTERPNSMPRRTLIERYEASGFPSIHSARVSYLAVAVAVLHNNLITTLAAALLCIIVGYSRIYLKKHRLADVIGGILIGSIITLLAI